MCDSNFDVLPNWILQNNVDETEICLQMFLQVRALLTILNNLNQLIEA